MNTVFKPTVGRNGRKQSSLQFRYK